MDRVIFHVDVNSAFLSWEAVYRLKHLGGSLDLREIPSAIGGDVTKRHGIILAKSIPAKKYKVHTGESIPEALRKCPELVLAPPNYNLYQRCSNAFMGILRRYTDIVEQYSIDEAYMDMTGTERLFGTPVIVANEIRECIHQELGFTVNIGISSNKLLAKMASDFTKPDKVHTLWPDEISSKMWKLPIGDLFFVGRATNKKLANMGIHTIGELANTNPMLLKSHLKKHGEVIWNFANGIDTESVIDEPVPNKGYGNSTTISFDVTNVETAKKVLLSLAETVGTRLRADNVKIGVVSVGIRDYNLAYYGHQMKLQSTTNITNEIHAAACQLFDEMWNGIPIRHLGIHTSQVTNTDTRQISLFDVIDYEKQERMDRMVDEIRKKYGNDSVMRASFIRPEEGKYIDHLSGGISREKRTVNYSIENVE